MRSAEEESVAENRGSSADTPAAATFHKYLPILLLLFVGSGFAALIYEVVWLQLLQLVIGSSAVSLGVLLGTFMGGMCLGSLLLPRLISPRRHPLRVYALIELGIAACALALLYGMPTIDQIYIAHVGHGLASILFRGLMCAACLLIPTLLMGATLPAMARWVEATPRGVSWMGFFYGGNIAGAVFGCLVAGFYLLRVYDMAVATYVAAVVDLVVALIALLLARSTKRGPLADCELQIADSIRLANLQSVISNPKSIVVYVVIGLSGLTALGAEVTWTRILSLLLGGTVYTFSIILAVFLAGLGIGSSIGSVMARDSSRPRLALGICQLLLMGAIAWTAYMVSRSLPYWPVNPAYSKSPWFDFQLDLVRVIWAILPGAILWGASFPLALAAAASPGRDSGRLVGSVYAANTVGAIIGSLAFSMILIPWIGTRGSQRVMIAVSAVGAMLILASMLRSPQARPAGGTVKRFLAVAFLAIVPALAVLLAWSVPIVPWGLTAYGRNMASWASRLVPGITPEKDVPHGGGEPDVFCTYAAEGMNVSIAVTETKAGVRSFHAAGKVQASNDSQDMRLQRMLGHIAALVHKDPRSVLVVACGAGVTAGSFVPYPDVKRIVICDIEPLVPRNVAPRFAAENYNVVADPRTEVICDDGRHFIRTTKEKFDIITSDPIDPWVKGCAALNTVEYYDMCKRHLNPGGIMALWMPLYESNPETAKSLIATFFRVFRNGILWSNDINGEGYDAVLFGQIEPTVIDLDEMQERFETLGNGSVAQSLKEAGFQSPLDLFATYAGRAADLQDWMQGAQINTDRNLRLQYLAGMWLNSYLGTEILNGILKHYSFPGEVFVGSDQEVQVLRQELDKTRQVARAEKND
jgi:spermidine synthase